MKQMRSRFRLLALMIACGFFLTFLVCTVTVLKDAGISWSSLVPLRTDRPAPVPSLPPQGRDSGEPVPAVTETVPPADASPETDRNPDSQYNVFGL